jgi:hypothetical protein
MTVTHIYDVFAVVFALSMPSCICLPLICSYLTIILVAILVATMDQLRSKQNSKDTPYMKGRYNRYNLPHH